jgi:pimeloyl-ACP methyl ester carboxylesterase
VPEQRVNGAKLFYELNGSGDPLVLVHGSWVDHKDWQLVVPHLARSFRVLTYDRRGHSLSERPLGQGSRREDEEDLAALMEALDLAPAHVAANSFGRSIAVAEKEGVRGDPVSGKYYSRKLRRHKKSRGC